MPPLYALLILFSAFVVICTYAAPELDPCAVIGGKKWVAPADVRACFSSFKVNQTIKSNILDVVGKTLAFHVLTNYEIKAPEPFTADVHEDLFKDLARIENTSYASDYDLHIDVSRTLKRLNDGHCVWANACYDSAFLNFLPIPLVLLTQEDGSQNIYIAPEAFEVASAEFSDEIAVWQDALPLALKGKLESLSGAKVVLINGKPPFDAVNTNALITGSYQPFGTRQSSFFSSYGLPDTTFSYVLGDFAQQPLPLDDSVDLVIQRVHQTTLDNITLPYRSRINPTTVPFKSSATYRANNCVPVDGTNGVDLNAVSLAASLGPSPAAKFQQAPVPSSRKHKMNVMMDTVPVSDISLPPGLQPSAPALNASFGGGAFFMQKDGKTGVLVLGSFSGDDLDVMQDGLLKGLLTLKEQGATQLIVDVTNNGGGFICAADWLHRIIIGPKNTTIPGAGLDTKARAAPLARLVVQAIADDPNLDPFQALLYNPLNRTNANNVQFSATDNWLLPPVNLEINGHADSFSPRLGAECPPGPNGFAFTPPDAALFNASKVVIVSNGRCASSCALFSVTMAKEEGVKTVFVGGKNDVKQEYCGTVGGQSTDYSTLDTDIKTTHLKTNSLAPPDLLVNGVQGITWRSSFGVWDAQQPEEFQDHPVDLNLSLTPDLVNNPVAIWEVVAAKFFV
ncbi:hypothetical protein B0H16DRAFT_1402826 [Mycena metata]|uniref:Tail specific protease domain-containing protein n=1 Tax=Mycena metata TaxID=1033252 RepID=A0AAD7P2G7_9AGAR|nr:hypothetical protein B0H16DRAFT_1402826 [Mycena metata]